MTSSTSESSETKTILVVEDEPEIRRFLRATLESRGYSFLECQTARDALAMVADERPDLVLLDLGLPDMDGLDVIKKLRGWTQVPIIILSARGQESDKIKALDSGADDYLTKPFSVGELQSRIRVAFRHSEQIPNDVEQPVFAVGNLRVDLEQRHVFIDSREVHLTPLEYRLLTTLIKHAGKVVTHRQLLREVWGPVAVMETHYLRVYMTHLRRKIEPDSARPQFLLTEPGVGYRLTVDEA